MNAPSQQFRIVFTNAAGSRNGTVFVDGANEAAALLFFAKAFPHSIVTSVKLEPVDPCAAYARKEMPCND